MKAIAADLPDDLGRTVTGGAAGGSFSIPTGDTTYQADFVGKDLTANRCVQPLTVCMGGDRQVVGVWGAR